MKRMWREVNKRGSGANLLDMLLVSRGLKTKAEIKEFLNPLEMKLSDPNVFTDMAKCTARIDSAVKNNEKILIYGDFDADGVTATAVLYKTLTALGANVDYYLPDREKESHGLNTKTIVNLMTTVKPKLVITVDCGITDVEEVKFLNSFKIDTIITDHHEAPGELPQAFGIINPKAPDALDSKLTAKQITHLTYLAGVGVAFKLAQALLSQRTEIIPELLPLVAVGTIADMVPLLGENRYFAARGLRLIRKNPGLDELLKVAKHDGEVKATNVGFKIAPRINATGRVDAAGTALKLLISDNKKELKVAAQTLDELNNVRKSLEETAFKQAEASLTAQDKAAPAIILFNPEWHGGVVGLIAGRLAKKYNKPAFVMTCGEETNKITCSARSAAGVQIHEVISSHADILTGGGHSMAGGFLFDTDQTPFEKVKQTLNKTISDILQGQEATPFLDIDLELMPDEIDITMIDEISKLEPFGMGNPEPVFALKNLVVKEKKLQGEDKKTLKLVCTQGGREFQCIRFKEGDIALVKGDTLDLAFCPDANEWNGTTTLQLQIKDIQSDCLTEEDGTPTVKVHDHRKKTGIMPQVEDYVKTSKLNISVFAENKGIVDSLPPALKSKVVNRDNIPNCDALMFFDYPADRETFAAIASKAPALHFFPYKPRIFDEKEFLKTAAGMLKYAHNNTGGTVELCRCAGFLGKSYAVFNTLFKIFEEIGLIKMLDKTPNTCKISYNEGVDLAGVLHNKHYAGLLDLIDECEAFQKSLMQDPVETFIA